MIRVGQCAFPVALRTVANLHGLSKEAVVVITAR